jgi:hypothetical protein
MLKSFRSFVNEPSIRLSLGTWLLLPLPIVVGYGRAVDGWGLFALSADVVLAFLSGVIMARGVDRWRLLERRDEHGRWKKAS